MFRVGLFSPHSPTFQQKIQFVVGRGCISLSALSFSFSIRTWKSRWGFNWKGKYLSPDFSVLSTILLTPSPQPPGRWKLPTAFPVRPEKKAARQSSCWTRLLTRSVLHTSTAVRQNSTAQYRSDIGRINARRFHRHTHISDRSICQHLCVCRVYLEPAEFLCSTTRPKIYGNY